MRPLLFSFFIFFSARKIKIPSRNNYFQHQVEKKRQRWRLLRDTGFSFDFAELAVRVNHFETGYAISFFFFFYFMNFVVVVSQFFFFFFFAGIFISLFVIVGFDNRRHLRRRWQQTIHVGEFFLWWGNISLVFSSFLRGEDI